MLPIIMPALLAASVQQAPIQVLTQNDPIDDATTVAAVVRSARRDIFYIGCSVRDQRLFARFKPAISMYNDRNRRTIQYRVGVAPAITSKAWATTSDNAYLDAEDELVALIKSFASAPRIVFRTAGFDEDVDTIFDVPGEAVATKDALRTVIQACAKSPAVSRLAEF